MKGYRTVETDQRVTGISPELKTRWYWRAERRCQKLNKQRLVDFYRYVIIRSEDGKWEVVAMQNLAESLYENNSPA